MDDGNNDKIEIERKKPFRKNEVVVIMVKIICVWMKEDV